MLEMNEINWIIALVFAYLIGNLSPATMISRMRGIDIRKEGSGNPGTTNVLRTVGKKYAALTLLIDALKGVVAVLVGRYLGGEGLAMACSFIVLTGHIWPVIYRFHGGKGIATGLGVLLAIDWRIGLICLGTAALGFLLSGRVSIGSLITALALPLYSWLLKPEFFIWSFAIAVVVIWKHRSNLRRIMDGTEPKISFKKKTK